ncbi:hypothetical protein [Janthinobacterium sp. BJB304]|uniref:hypothetical protein n=1 Tax=Janthinobacterium sp. BJB304 TaxID=1572871 RepID=UPI000C0D35A3|nr:hypothetical protein [Janthinobacterium sp. BJB304]PHV36377.1 hypothetical protein CSQ95_24810 [Janthinobacterium sp. BJB304]
MQPLFRAAGMLALMALGACSDERHPLERQLLQLRPDTVAALPDMGWPAGTLLCPLALYQNELPGSAPPADRVNAFLKQKQFLGDENWSLIVVKPQPAENAGAGIEQLFFKRADYDVINEPPRIARDAQTLPAGFAPQVCVSVEQARVLVTREQRSHRKLVIFGTA